MKITQRALISVCAVVFVCGTGCCTDRMTSGLSRIPLPEKLPPHPRLFLNQDEIDRIREEAKSDPWAARILERTKKSADYWNPSRLSKLKPGARHSAFGRTALDLALAYQFSGNVQYARQSANILLAYADLAETLQPTGTAGLLTDSTMGEACLIVDICWAYDLIYNAEVLSSQQKRHIETDLFDRMAYVSGRGCNHWSSSNWRARAMVVLAAAAFTTGNRDLMDEALNGRLHPDYKAYQYGFAQHVGHAIRDDGTYWETPFGYTWVCLYSMAWIAEMARHSGLDLWNMKIARLQELPARTAQRDLGIPGTTSLTDAMDVMLYRAFPNRLVPQAGNSNTKKLAAVWGIYQAAYRANPDPRYAWLIRQTRNDLQARSSDPQKRPVDIWSLAMSPRNMDPGRFSFADDVNIGLTGRHRSGCTLLPGAGYAIMRGNGNDVNSTCFEMRYGKIENSHDHPDRLAMTLYGLGRILAPDAGKAGYGGSLQLTWMKQTIAHNTVTIDEISQYPQEDKNTIWVDERPGMPATGELVFFYADDKFKAVRAKTDKAYNNCTLDRTLVLFDPFVVDIFTVSCGYEARIDWAWHGYGAATATVPGELSTEALSAQKGYLHLTNTTSETSGEDWDVTWSIGDAHMRLCQLGETDTMHVLAQTPTGDRRRRTAAIARRTGSNTVFISVIEPYTSESRMKQLRATIVNETVTVNLEHAGGIDTVIIPLKAGRHRLTLRDVQSNAYALWQRQTGNQIVASGAVVRNKPDD